MNKTLSNLFIFTAGAAIGSVVTWKLVKNKYARIAQEEIETIRDWYMQRNQSAPVEPVEEEPAPVVQQVPEFTEQDRIDYANIANAYSNNNEKGVPAPVKRPYVISPDEFDEIGYQTVSLTLYEDGVVEDDRFYVLDDEEIEEKISEMTKELSSYPAQDYESIAKSRLKSEKYEKYINELYEKAEIKEF